MSFFVILQPNAYIPDGRALLPVHGHAAGVQDDDAARRGSLPGATTTVPGGATGGARTEQRSSKPGNRIPERVPRTLHCLPTLLFRY